MSTKRQISPQPSSSRKSRRRDEIFSFIHLKNEVETLLQRYHSLILDWPDFWKFVPKFEAMRRAKPNENISKRMYLRLKISPKELFQKVSTREFSESKLTELVLVIEAYLVFKQTEKLTKLQKLRKIQKELPVAAYESCLINLMASDNVVIVAGDTGCGKSTQIPQFVIRGLDARVLCTQPRRLACISLASRLKYETLTEFTQEVGYQIRFEKQRNNDTRILFMTEGLLLRQLAADPVLTGWDVVILDEVHERHIHGDFLLGLLQCLLLQRPDLKLILMSATINIELFHNYFHGRAQILQIPGRLFPVEVHYRPAVACDTKSRAKVNCTPYLQILQIVETKFKGEKGDVLIFLSGVSEIDCLMDAVREYNKKDQTWIVLPLHSALPLAEQDKVFDYAPVGIRKCIIATNIAETSLTIDGIRFVIDSGKVKEMMYDAVARVQRLKEFWVSKSSAEQRKGRAGRTGPGICFRIYSKEDYEAMDEFTTPEIKRVPLESVLLQVMAMGLPDVRKFPFVEPPNEEDIENGIVALKQHDALTTDEKLTATGKLLASLPVDIQVGKMLLMGSAFKQSETTLVLAAALSVPSPLTSIGARDLDCERERQEEESDLGDPITLVSLYRAWLVVKMHKDDSRRWCRKRGLEEQRFYELTKLRMQFKDILVDSGLLEEAEEMPSTSAERRIRNGEVKLLKSLRAQASKKPARKELRPRMFETEEEPSELDVRDVEFRLKSDPTSVQNILKEINISSHRDVTIVRLIFCYGLYPQFAIADEFNSYKSELVFHTKNKSFIFLHPTSYFAKHKDILQLKEPDITVPANSVKYSSRLPFSSRHQLLCYLNILETNKIYLTNMLRMPALQTCLLFCKQIDTSFDFSKFVFDAWLMIEPLCTRQAEILILRLVRLRKNLAQIVEQKLARTLYSRSEAVQKLTNDLIEFLSTEIVYGVKRLLPADLKYIYSGTNNINITNNPFDPEFEVQEHNEKGGYIVTDYLTYNCLLSNDGNDAFRVEKYQCSFCGISIEFNTFQRIEHESTCKSEGKTVTEPTGPTKPNQLPYNCDKCKKLLYLTSIEILRHKNSCKISE